MKMLEQTPVKFDISKLNSVIPTKVFDLHYNHIYKKHVDRFNKGEGDFAFDKAGSFLHGMYFENIRDARDNNLPYGLSKQVIDLRWGSYDRFVSTLVDKSLSLQGNGWVFMNTSGYLNIIPNNRIVDNVALLFDCWEHAYILQWADNIDMYIKKHLDIIDWEVVNYRIENQKQSKI
mgnify:CR=1 FL=1